MLRISAAASLVTLWPRVSPKSSPVSEIDVAAPMFVPGARTAKWPAAVMKVSAAGSGSAGRDVDRHRHRGFQQLLYYLSSGAEQASRGIEFDDQESGPVLLGLLDGPGNEPLFDRVDNAVHLGHQGVRRLRKGQSGA